LFFLGEVSGAVDKFVDTKNVAWYYITILGTYKQVIRIRTLMKIIKRKILYDFKEKHIDACSQVDSWEAEVNAANWSRSSDIRQRYATASFLSDSHVVFNLKGNKYRLLVQVNYKSQIVLIKKVGTHNEYMKW